MTVERVGVVGCGLMGSGIAEVCARAGTDVVVREADEALLRAGAARIEQSLGRAVRAGKVSEDERERALGRLHFSTDWEAMADRQLVVEAVTEDTDAKLAVFRDLDRTVAASEAVLASNTSSIPIMKLAMVTGRPEQWISWAICTPLADAPTTITPPSASSNGLRYVSGVTVATPDGTPSANAGMRGTLNAPDARTTVRQSHTSWFVATR